MRLSIASVVSCLAALAMAATSPDYSQDPSGNAILKPGLNEQVPAGKPYTIEWDPTTTGPVSLILLRGPSTNVKPIETLADSIPNSGSFSWTPSTSLEPDTTHYGLMLVVEGTGQYQYSTQFGISNPDYTGSTSNSSSTATPTGTKSSSTTETSSKPSTTDMTTTTATSSASADSTTATTTETAPTTLVTTSSASGVPTSTVVVTVPNSTGAGSSVASGSASASSASSTPTPSTTLSNGGDRKAISLGAVVVGAFAVMAF